MYDCDVVKVTTYFCVSEKDSSLISEYSLSNLLTCFNAFQWPQSNATLRLIVQVLLLQEVHVGDAQRAWFGEESLVRRPLVVDLIAIARLIWVLARLQLSTWARSAVSEIKTRQSTGETHINLEAHRLPLPMKSIIVKLFLCDDLNHVALFKSSGAFMQSYLMCCVQ